MGLIQNEDKTVRPHKNIRTKLVEIVIEMEVTPKLDCRNI